jgi:hypothetical protein
LTCDMIMTKSCIDKVFTKEVQCIVPYNIMHE